MITRALVGVSLSAVAACGAPSPPETVPAPTPLAAQEQDRPERTFAFEALDGSLVTSGSLRGRMTLIALLASYDDPSQAEALFVRTMVKRHVPRINALALMLEPVENRPMIEAFVEVLELPYPAVWADAATVAGRGPFPGLHHVPSVVLLDRQNREAWRHIGLCDESCLEEALQSYE